MAKLTNPQEPKDRRFVWKNLVRRSVHLSRGAKQFAGFMVDEYIYKGKGDCFAGNASLAAGMGVTDRSIQRYLTELADAGWITKSKRRRVRRVITLAFPAGQEGDSKHDTNAGAKMTRLSSKDDRAVVPYMKHENKQTNASLKIPSFKCISVQNTEESQLSAWEHWVATNTELVWEKLCQVLWNGSGYNFPSRHPPGDEFAEKQAKDFFKAMVTRSNL